MSIIGTVFLLAAEAVAEAEPEGGFGLNVDILETNIINLGLLIGILFYFGRKVLSNTLNDRRSNIETEILTAEKQAKEAAAALSEAQKNLTQAQAEAKSLLAAAQENAELAKAAILERAEADVEKLKQAAARDLDTETERAIAELKQRVVSQALQKAEAQLSSGITDNAQQTLIDRSIALLGG
ncbi:F0F1 ATP synthase subunit B [Calothrix sp. 336/3]|uniref:F0F1 ATP synthase subunit B n=1 Tax=Calothrix sp. 336/3 TaxID=1337936 RepID=UPI0004E38CDC|nr:F0F1 ATP synthase subunit B [Calothrix sp. 336/3]AKG23933.1 ATP synthase F0F1 subunit B [Calothrix sp. 336/3]